MYTDGDIKERFEDFYDIARDFCDDFNLDQSVKAEVDPTAMYLAVVALYDDVARYKEYHLSDSENQKSNSIKRAVFSVKWIMRFSPIIFPRKGHVAIEKSVDNDPFFTSNFSDQDVLVNAVFALHFAFINIELDCGENFRVSSEYYYQILYDLLYRDMSGDALILIFQIISDMSAQDGRPSLFE